MSDNQIICAAIFYLVSVIAPLLLIAKTHEEIVIKDVFVCVFIGWAILIAYPFTIIDWNHTVWRKK